jgi:hypothetical protein
MKYINIKSGKIYNVLSMNVINGTNKDDGKIMVLYKGERKNNNEIATFVRELDEFLEKFTPYKK